MEREQEIDLVNRAKNDPEAFGALFDHYYLPILRYATWRTADVATAQDITSETFFKALKKIQQFQWRKTSFGSWLYAIATNELRQYYRKHKRPVISLEQIREQDGVEIADTHDLAEEIMEAQRIVEQHATFKLVQHHLVKLPLKYQEIISLRFFEDKKISEIGEILGKREGTVKSLLSRGLKRLRSTTTSSTMQPIHLSSIIQSED